MFYGNFKFSFSVLSRMRIIFHSYFMYYYRVVYGKSIQCTFRTGGVFLNSFLPSRTPAFPIGNAVTQTLAYQIHIHFSPTRKHRKKKKTPSFQNPYSKTIILSYTFYPSDKFFYHSIDFIRLIRIGIMTSILYPLKR